MPRLGAIHTPRPAGVPYLSQRARLDMHTPPPALDWFTHSPATGDDLGNNDVGDCLPVSVLWSIYVRLSTVWGTAVAPTRQQAFDLYTRWGGFDQQTLQPDNGCDVAASMLSWSTQGVQVREQLEDVPLWFALDHTNLTEIKTAILLTGPVRLTLALPEMARNIANFGLPVATGPDWQPGSWGYHSVCCGKYSDDSFTIRTWGEDVAMVPSWWMNYVVAADATLTRSWLDHTGVTPAGLNWDIAKAEMTGLLA